MKTYFYILTRTHAHTPTHTHTHTHTHKHTSDFIYIDRLSLYDFYDIYLFILFIIYIYTDNWEYPAYFKHSFSSKYPYHKVPDRIYCRRQKDLKALKNYQIFWFSIIDSNAGIFTLFYIQNYLNFLDLYLWELIYPDLELSLRYGCLWWFKIIFHHSFYKKNNKKF